MKRGAILVIRPDGRFSGVLRKSGCEVINLELITTKAVDDQSELAETIKKIDRYDGIFLTSPAAAEIFLGHLAREGKDFLGKAYVLGERSNDVLYGSGLNVIFGPDANTAQELIASLGQAEFAGKNLLFIRGDRSVRTIPEMLRHVARVDELVVYTTVELSPDDSLIENVRAKLKANGIDWVCFFSPSGVDSFLARFGGENLERVRAAAVGVTTARRAKEVGLSVAFISARSNAEDFAAGFAALIKDLE